MFSCCVGGTFVYSTFRLFWVVLCRTLTTTTTTEAFAATSPAINEPYNSSTGNTSNSECGGDEDSLAAEKTAPGVDESRPKKRRPTYLARKVRPTACSGAFGIAVAWRRLCTSDSTVRDSMVAM